MCCPPRASACVLCAARNVPVTKRSTAVGVVTAASYAGTALAFGLSPLLITRLGWQWVFYLFGGAAVLWLPFWLPLNVYGGSVTTRVPKQSSDGGLEEQALLPAAAAAAAAVGAVGDGDGDGGGSSSISATGFRALLRRREVWAICACQFAQSYGMYGEL